MSPTGFTYYCWNDSFPRVSGDEPMPDIDAFAYDMFSPRERG